MIKKEIETFFKEIFADKDLPTKELNLLLGIFIGIIFLAYFGLI